MKITFLGTGTSQGVPVIGCTCNVCTSSDSRDKRLRTSIAIEVDGKTFIVDTGPDFRQQMLRANITDIHAVLYTHEHKDHVAGLDDIRPINFLHEKEIPIYAEERVLEALEREYIYIFDEKYNYPGLPRIVANTIENKHFSIDGVTIQPIRALHYKLPVFGFAIGDFAYLTDANFIEDTEKDKLRNKKVVVLNALRKEEHISHFTLQQALNLIEEVKPEKAYLIHASHQMGLHAELEQELPEGVFQSYDGLEVVV